MGAPQCPETRTGGITIGASLPPVAVRLTRQPVDDGLPARARCHACAQPESLGATRLTNTHTY
jgi:hypothetical protein